MYTIWCAVILYPSADVFVIILDKYHELEYQMYDIEWQDFPHFVPQIPRMTLTNVDKVPVWNT